MAEYFVLQPFYRSCFKYRSLDSQERLQQYIIVMGRAVNDYLVACICALDIELAALQVDLLYPTHIPLLTFRSFLGMYG